MKPRLSLSEKLLYLAIVSGISGLLLQIILHGEITEMCCF
jgi:hypothetical protein